MILDKYLPNEKTLFYDLKNNYTVNSKKFILYIKDIVTSDKKYFLLLGEIRLLDNFVFILNSFLSRENYDVYVTGSNSKMLSIDVISEFRERGDQIHLYPLSLKNILNLLINHLKKHIYNINILEVCLMLSKWMTKIANINT